MKFNLHFAKVVKIDDGTNHPDGKKENRIQIKVSPFMDEFTEIHLPWARPMLPAFTGASMDAGVSAVPSVGSYVWVWFEDEDNFKKAYYVFDGRYPTNTLAEKYYNVVQPKLNQLDQITTPQAEYPDVISFFYESGIAISYNRDTTSPEYTLYHPSGSYIIMDKDGNIGGFSSGKIQMKTQAGTDMVFDSSEAETGWTVKDPAGATITIKNGKITVESLSPILFKTTAENLKNVLELMLTALSTQILTGNMGQPVVWNANPLSEIIKNINIPNLLSNS